MMYEGVCRLHGDVYLLGHVFVVICIQYSGMCMYSRHQHTLVDLVSNGNSTTPQQQYTHEYITANKPYMHHGYSCSTVITCNHSVHQIT